MSLSKPRVRAVGSALAVSALLAAALVVPAATASAKAAPKAKVTLSIGDQGESLQEPQTLSGESKNAPYNVKWTDFTDGPDLDAAFAANKIDLGFEGDTAGLVATAGGSGVDVIAAVQEAPDAYFQVVASASSGITSIAGLKGKTVAFTPDSASEGYLLEALRQAGLSLSDITPVNITGGSSLTAVLASGQADAAVLASVQILTALAQDPSDVRLSAPNAVCDVLLVASKKSLANPAKRAALLQFVTRAVKSGIWVNKNSATYISDDLVGIDQFPATLAQSYWNLIGDPNWGPVTNAVIDHQRIQAGLLVGAGVFTYYASTKVLADNEFNAAINKQFNAAIEKAEK